MIKESKYILRKIVIGVGIALCLAFLNGCKVKAFNIDANIPVTYNYNTNSFYDNNSNYNLITSITRHNANKISYIYSDNDNNLIVSNNECTAIFDLTSYGANLSQVLILTNTVNSGANTYDGIYIIDDNYSHGVFSKNNGNNISIEINYYNNTSDIVALYKYLDSFGPSTEGGGCYYGQTGYGLADYTSSDYREIPIQHNKTLDTVVLANGMPIFDYNNHSEILKEIYVGSSSIPEFISFHQTTISNNNLIMGYNFSPEFSIFDTENYVYQYKFGENSTTWLSLTENEQNIRINANGTIYIRIKDLANNNVIDSATFTISDIGQFYDSNIDYKITFSGDYRTQNYLNNNVSSSASIIQEYQIFVDYFPKSSILTYQYQYVLENNSIDNNNWQTLSSDNKGNFTYVATQNGVLYARILDNENNVLTTSTFTVNSIGKLAYDNNTQYYDSFFTRLGDKLNYGGPITTLFRIPVNFLSKFYEKASLNYCSPYRLSNLLGVDFYLPCIDFKQKFGATYYNLFDIMLCILFSLNLFKFIYKLYNKFVSMEEVD